MRELADVDPVAAMRFGSDGDDPRRRRGLEALEQQMRQKKRGEVVYSEGQLEAIRRKAIFRGKEAGIVDEDVEPVVRREDLPRQSAHFGETREIGQSDLHPALAGMLGHKPAG